MRTWGGSGLRGRARGGGSGGNRALGGRGRALGSKSAASERLRRGCAAGSVSAGPVRRCRRVLGGLAWCCLVLGGGQSPPPSIDPPRRGAAAAAAGGTGGLTVPGGHGPGRPLRRERGGRGDTVPGTGGVTPGGRRGMGLECLVVAIPCACAARARGVVARWDRVVGSGIVGGGAGGSGGGAVGGGGAEACSDPVVILGSLGVCIYVLASRHWLISYSPIYLT